MPPFPSPQQSASLAALKQLQSGQDAQAAQAFGGGIPQRQDETDENLYRARMNGDRNWERALQGLQQGIDSDQSYLDTQNAPYEAIRQADREGIMHGFMGGQGQTPQGQVASMSPGQQEATHARSLAEEQMRQPLTISQGNQATQRDITRMQGENAIATEQEKQRGGLAIQEKFNEIYKTPSPGTSGRDIRSIVMPGRNGGGSVSFAPSPNINPLLQTVTGARKAYESANPGFLGMGGEAKNAAKTTYLQAVGNALSQAHFDPEVARFASYVASHDELRDMPLSGLLQHPAIMPALGGQMPGPDEMGQLENALRIARGLN